MILQQPFLISSRLLPAFAVDGVTVSLERSGYSHDGRDEFTIYFDCDQWEIEETDLRSGVGGCSTAEAFEFLLSFLTAAAESYDYRERTGRDGENEDLFDPRIVEWASHNSDELLMLHGGTLLGLYVEPAV